MQQFVESSQSFISWNLGKYYPETALCCGHGNNSNVGRLAWVTFNVLSLFLFVCTLIKPLLITLIYLKFLVYVSLGLWVLFIKMFYRDVCTGSYSLFPLFLSIFIILLIGNILILSMYFYISTQESKTLRFQKHRTPWWQTHPGSLAMSAVSTSLSIWWWSASKPRTAAATSPRSPTSFPRSVHWALFVWESLLCLKQWNGLGFMVKEQLFNIRYIVYQCDSFLLVSVVLLL